MHRFFMKLQKRHFGPILAPYGPKIPKQHFSLQKKFKVSFKTLCKEADKLYVWIFNKI